MYCTSYWKKWISIAANVSLQEFTALLGGKWLTLLPNTYNRITNQHDEMRICVSKFILGPQRTKKTGSLSQLPLSGICGIKRKSPVLAYISTSIISLSTSQKRQLENLDLFQQTPSLQPSSLKHGIL